MRRIALLLIVASSLSAGVCPADILNDGGFETSAAWAGFPTGGTLTANAANESQWWFGGSDGTWLRRNKAGYAPEGSWCAGATDMSGPPGALLQFVPLADEIKATLSFQYLLWRGEWGDTTAHYAVYGWHEGDTIDLSVSGPGSGTEILSGDLTTPAYYGAGNPQDYFSTQSDLGDIDTEEEFDYIGVWIQYSVQGGSFYVDDVHLNLTPVPEPATLSLLGVGALAILLRRRVR